MPSLLEKYSDEDFSKIVANSHSISEILIKLGYSCSSGGNHLKIKERIENLHLSTEHFYLTSKGSKRRTKEDVFVKDSTASQKTLREWFKKGNYSEYKCAICGQEANWQGKDLTLILDHIDGNNHNDVIENLRWVCPNCNQQLSTTGSRNYKWNETHLKNNKLIHTYCIKCGKEITSGALYCKECSYEQERKVLDRPSWKELKDMIRTTPFTQIGKKYGVTDNTIRKWCKFYNLPQRKMDISTYSDEEWESLLPNETTLKEGSKSSSSKKPVEQLNKDTGEIINTYESLSAAAEAIGTKPNVIGRVCNSQTRTCHDYRWRFKE